MRAKRPLCDILLLTLNRLSVSVAKSLQCGLQGRTDLELYQQEGSKYWTADFTVNGRRYRRSTKQTTRAKASEVAAEFLRKAQQDEQPTRKGPVPTLREFAEKTFLPWNDANARTKERTKDSYRYGWQLLSKQSIALTRMDAIKTTHIETIKIVGSPSTHNGALRTLRRMFHIACDLDLILKVPKFSLLTERQRSELITPEIEQRITEQLNKTRRKGALRAGLLIMLDCGLRPIEIVRLRIADCDLVRGFIRIETSKSKAGERLVPMTDRVRGLLFTQVGSRTDGWVFPSPRYPGEHIQRHALTTAWRVTANKAGVSPDVDLYGARHTYGTDVMRATKDPFLTMRLLGHADLSTTGRYQHPSMELVGALMNERNDLRHKQRHSGEMLQ